MPYQLERLTRNLASPITPDHLHRQIQHLLNVQRPRYRRLWAYYRNPMRPSVLPREDSGSERPYRQAQEWGLPSRITGLRSGAEVSAGQFVEGVQRKEVVVENDIGWRIDTMVDYLAGKPVVIQSAADAPERQQLITRLLERIFAHNGGSTFLQQLALLGAVHGFVDVLVKLNPHGSMDDDSFPDGGAPSASAGPALCDGDDPTDPGASEPSRDASLQRIARCVRFEIVEPARALPLLSPLDCTIVEAYVQVYEVPGSSDSPSSRSKAHGSPSVGLKSGLLDRLTRLFRSPSLHLQNNDSILITDILTPTRWQRYVNETLKSEGTNSLGVLPLVHIQNIPLPFEYSGASDVEPLIPLQDELNTRMSDRASRITLQSFKMYLGKGIENFTDMPVAPGRMWMTDNDRADVIEFGGDAANPSEDAHIEQLREAMDKTSGVTPIAAGVTKGRIGRLTSAVALRVTLMALLARTEKKRTTYGAGIERMCELALAWLDRAGSFHTTPDERRVRLHWSNPLPDNHLERLQEAQLKANLGVPKELVLRELGYQANERQRDKETRGQGD